MSYHAGVAALIRVRGVSVARCPVLLFYCFPWVISWDLLRNWAKGVIFPFSQSSLQGKAEATRPIVDAICRQNIWAAAAVAQTPVGVVQMHIQGLRCRKLKGMPGIPQLQITVGHCAHGHGAGGLKPYKIRTVNQQGITVLLNEQNANMALKVADYAYVLETGNLTLSGTGAELLANEQVKAAYLGRKRTE